MTQDPDATLPPAPWKRPLLFAASFSLLAFGAYLQKDRLPFWPQSETLELANGDVIEEENRFVAYINEPDDEAGGSGRRHKGEEGVMGRPTSKLKSGLYAMKGPRSAAPQMARSFDPEVAARHAGIMGSMRSESGHFLASPTGERYGEWGTNATISTQVDAKSTFSVDVDTAAYANTRRFLVSENHLPPPAAVRTEELVNYFDYAYPLPDGETPFSVTTEVGPAPWDATKRLVHIGLQGKVVGQGDVPPRNLVFLIDVSGSMSGELPLVKQGLTALAQTLRPEDRLSIVVYAGAAGAVLPPTPGDDAVKIRGAIAGLRAGGGTAGADGIQLAYRYAIANFVDGGINRVLLATDGDFNVGISDFDDLVELIEEKRESGVFLSVLGVGSGNLNDHMMEQLADKGNGNYAYLDNAREAQKVLVDEAGATLDAIAKDVKIQVEFDPDRVASHRLIGYENRVLAHEDFDDDTKDAGEIGSGHTVTALYEVQTIPGDDPLMTLDLRYKLPDEDTSNKVSLEVEDAGNALADTSDAYRFSAAVAAFGQKLRGADTEDRTTYGEILALAKDALGDDPYCHRHEFLDIVWRAADLSKEALDRPDTRCQPHPAAPRVVSAAATPTSTPEPFDWRAFVLEVIRLVPPLAALPLFVLAFRRRRKI